MSWPSLPLLIVLSTRTLLSNFWMKSKQQRHDASMASRGGGGGYSRTGWDVEKMRASRGPSLAAESLERADVRSGQNMERTQAGKEHSPTGDLLPFVFILSSHIALMSDLNSGGLHSNLDSGLTQMCQNYPWSWHLLHGHLSQLALGIRHLWQTLACMVPLSSCYGRSFFI